MPKPYITQPSENFAVREGEVGRYHPDLCYKHGQTHAAYGWSRRHEADWTQEQKDAYDRGWKDNGGK